MRESTLGGTMGDNLYGASPRSHVTECVHSKNPHGHNPECSCGWFARSRPPQVIPYLEADTAAEDPA